jgi:hypothetical protein
MYNLRQRDAIKGRGELASAVEEYGDLDQALNRLYANPFDQKALYYSQKFHGRLEDTLNNRAGSTDPSFQSWHNEQLMKDQYPSSPQEKVPRQEEIQTGPQPNSQRIDSIVNNLTQVADPQTLQVFVNALDQLDTGSYVGEAETYNVLRAISDGLKENMQGPASMTPGAAISIPTLLKMADNLEELDAELSSIVRNYIEENNESEDNLPIFPEKASILKEKANWTSKIT